MWSLDLYWGVGIYKFMKCIDRNLRLFCFYLYKGWLYEVIGRFKMENWDLRYDFGVVFFI